MPRRKRGAYAPKKERAGCHPDEWNTPPDERSFVLRIRGGHLPDLDPATKGKRLAFGRDYFTPSSRVPGLRDRNSRHTRGGLAHHWHGFIFLNMPYSTADDWMQHLVCQVERTKSPATVLALVPVRTGRPWWQDYATRATARWDVPGRIRFFDPVLNRIGTQPTFDSSYLLFDPYARYIEAFARECAARCKGTDRILRPNEPRPLAHLPTLALTMTTRPRGLQRVRA